MARQHYSKLYNIADGAFSKIVARASSYADILRECGIQYKGGNVNTVKRRISLLKLDDSHIPKGVGSNQHRKFEYRQVSKEEAMKEYFIDGKHQRATTIKRLVLRFGLLNYKCECGNDGSWNGNRLVLQLDHKDGNTENNKLLNLRFLCPNCHSQTKNFAGKNCKK